MAIDSPFDRAIAAEREFCLAMACHLRDEEDRERSLEYYEAGQTIMRRDAPGNPDLQALCRETAELLGAARDPAAAPAAESPPMTE
jgi:hypothetical protein